MKQSLRPPCSQHPEVTVAAWRSLRAPAPQNTQQTTKQARGFFPQDRRNILALFSPPAVESISSIILLLQPAKPWAAGAWRNSPKPVPAPTVPLKDHGISMRQTGHGQVMAESVPQKYSRNLQIY